MEHESWHTPTADCIAWMCHQFDVAEHAHLHGHSLTVATQPDLTMARRLGRLACAIFRMMSHPLGLHADPSPRSAAEAWHVYISLSLYGPRIWNLHILHCNLATPCRILVVQQRKGQLVPARQRRVAGTEKQWLPKNPILITPARCAPHREPDYPYQGQGFAAGERQRKWKDQTKLLMLNSG